MKFERVHENERLQLLRCISGSKAYGLDTPQSDTDIKGVFYLDKDDYYSLYYTEQVANSTNDIVYYELKRFIEMLVRNNPNILELLNSPADCILYRRDVMNLVKPELFLSRLCQHAFAGYAQTQIKKAKGLNKKIFNPVDEKRKTVIDFCYIISGYQTLPLRAWLDQQGFTQEDCGLVRVPHARDIYALFHNSQLPGLRFAGIYSGEDANEVRLSSVEQKLEPLALISFNKDGYSAYCKDYREYWDWVGKRNHARFQNTLAHGKNYDAKNMMHTFRLLHMAAEIASEQKIHVRRPDREFLMKVRSGHFLYEDLVTMAEERVQMISELFAKSDLPETPDEKQANELLIRMREELYRK